MKVPIKVFERTVNLKKTLVQLLEMFGGLQQKNWEAFENVLVVTFQWTRKTFIFPFKSKNKFYNSFPCRCVLLTSKEVVKVVGIQSLDIFELTSHSPTNVKNTIGRN